MTDIALTPAKAGWEGLPEVEMNGENWTLDVAAEVLGISERDLRDLVRIVGLKPAGTMNMAHFRRPGRHPRAYEGAKLAQIYDAVRQIARDVSG